MANQKGRIAKSAGTVTTTLGVAAAIATFLTRPEVKAVFGSASATTRRWAANVKSERSDRVVRASSKTGLGGFVKGRVGAGALLRRLDELSAAVADVASLDPTISDRLAVEERELRIRISAAAKLSPERRRPKLRALEAELDEFEQALATAIG
jgi:hypothetical protein